jgi:hypothetical protein
MAIGVHILGPGFGESIVLELPDGTVGVIDTFLVGGASNRRCPPLELLRNQFPGQRLSFLAITHPHADHCRGASSLVQELDRKAHLWLFETHDLLDLQLYFRRVHERRQRDRTESDVGAETGSIGRELVALCDFASRHPNARPLRPDETFLISDRQVAVTFLTPEFNAVKPYKQSLKRNLKSIVSDGPELNRNWEANDLDHNLVSGAILIQHGATRLLFLADAVGPVWNGWQQRTKSQPDSQFAPVHLIKVSHHGSDNGFHAPLFESACAEGNAVAVVTPFDRQRSPLPPPNGTELLGAGVREILCTNWLKASLSSESLWYPPSSKHDAAPAELIRDLMRLWKLRRRLKILSDNGEDQALRKTILSAVNEDGPFVRLAAESETSTRSEDDFRISFRFDDRGNENINERRYGRWAGRLSTNRERATIA